MVNVIDYLLARLFQSMSTGGGQWWNVFSQWSYTVRRWVRA